MSAVLDPFILEKAPGPLVELDQPLVRARAAFTETLAALTELSDTDLPYLWDWVGNDADVRYGFYRVVELLESATSEAARAMSREQTSEARGAVAAATASRWALHGVLATLDDADLDADPGHGEWSVRRTMQHIINSQRGYAWGSARWLSVRDQPRPSGRQRLPAEPGEQALPDEEDEGLGSLAGIRDELDQIVDVTSSRFATLTDDEMALKSGWYGFAVTIGFRQWRWASHIAEHTIQIEKALDMLGRRRSEVDWLSRLMGQAYGRLEAIAFGRASAAASSTVYDQAARDLSALYPTVVAAAKAALPAPEDE